jgi:hypothetical protein
LVKYTLSDVLEFIKRDNLRIIQVYAGHLDKIGDEDYPVMAFNTFKTDKTPDSMVVKISDYLTRFPSRFTLLCKAAPGSTEAIQKFYFEPSVLDRPALAPAPVSAPVSDVLNYAIQVEQLRAEIRMQGFEREKEDLRREIEKERGINGRFAAVVEVLVEKFAPALGLAPAPVAMQGYSAHEFEAAIDFLVETFGADGVCALAKLLSEKPEFVQIVKSQLK